VTVYQLNPLTDPRWLEFVQHHERASVFHSPGWLSALRQTYGYEPFVVTTSSGPTLENGVVVCRVKGWMSRRLVSLPFSDHCDPLVDGSEDLSEMLALLAGDAWTAGWRSVELRPRAFVGQLFEVSAAACGLKPSGEYYLHRIDLRAEATEIFRRFHRSSTQRAIRRAEREGLTYEAGTSDRLLASFYRLLRLTRRRHGLPPQPLAWFRNLVACLGDRVLIHMASKDGQPIASILTLSFKKTIVYKYGGSDASLHHLGGMPFLFWRVIQDAQTRGLAELDLGRSDVDQPGLIAFKEHLGATRSMLTYYRYPEQRRTAARSGWISRVGRGIFARLPDATLNLAGRLLYKHLG
jgi:lipid II:glycine glycyltransferase (peptidoglycan interpeptide bridge formation enzyme)